MKRENRPIGIRAGARLAVVLGVVALMSSGCTFSTYVKSHLETISNNETGTVFRQIECESGDNASGGGVRVQAGGNIRASEPFPAATNQTPSGWLGGWDNVAGKQISVYVVCLGEP